MRGRRLVAVALAVVCLAGSPAVAGTSADPDVVDPCGPTGQVEEQSVGVRPGWADICAGWFEQLDSGLRVTATFAEAIPDDRLGLYRAGWRTGDCAYQLSHDRGLGYYGTGGIFVSDLGRTGLRVRCGEPVESECKPPAVGLPSVGTCERYPNEQNFTLVDAVAVDGKSLSWTVRFDGELAALADELGAGTAITRPSLYAAAKVGVPIGGAQACSGTFCAHLGSDSAVGRDE